MHFIRNTALAAVSALAVMSMASVASAHTNTCTGLKAWGGGADKGTAMYQASIALDRAADRWSDRRNHSNYSWRGHKHYDCSGPLGNVQCWGTGTACLKKW